MGGAGVGRAEPLGWMMKGVGVPAAGVGVGDTGLVAAGFTAGFGLLAAWGPALDVAGPCAVFGRLKGRGGVDEKPGALTEAGLGANEALGVKTED